MRPLRLSRSYGLSCDWYTVGVLAYEFSAGTVPYAHPEEDVPNYRTHDFKDPDAEAFVKGDRSSPGTAGLPGQFMQQDHSDEFCLCGCTYCSNARSPFHFDVF